MGILDDLGIAPLPDDLHRVETRLHDAVDAPDRFLGEVAAHLLGAGGKRLRPVVALCAAYAAKGAEPVHPDAITGASIVELVHLGSLYHDDVIDEAETRRGAESVNHRWSNSVAILSGDYLLAQASVLAASLGAEVAGLVGATISELCRGQVLEMQYDFNVDRTVEVYRSSISGKTASLLATSARIGGMVSGVGGDALEALTDFGQHLGMCFQIVDDVLDLTASEDALGKPAGNDLHEGVYTLPVLYALETSGELRDLLGKKLEWDDVATARELVLATDGLARATRDADDHARSAVAALDRADELDATLRGQLGRLVDALTTRAS